MYLYILIWYFKANKLVLFYKFLTFSILKGNPSFSDILLDGMHILLDGMQRLICWLYPDLVESVFLQNGQLYDDILLKILNVFDN